MASQGVAATSRLAEMQMRFQRKQLLEREQKKLALTAGDGISETSPIASKNAIGNGKVRQMFEQRRGVGIDRSHPLKPIASTTSTMTRTTTQQNGSVKRFPGGTNTMTTSRRTVINTKQTSTTMKNSHSHPNTFSSNGNLFGEDLDEVDNLESETFPKEFSSLSLDNTRVMGPIVSDNNNNSRSTNGIRKDIMDTTITMGKKSPTSTNGIRLNPVITKKSPSITAPRTTAQPRTPSSASRTSTMSRTSTITNGSTKSPSKTTASPSSTKNPKTTTKAVNGKPATFVMAVKPPPRIKTPPPGMATCHYCQRNFNEDRLQKHEDVCGKMTTKKRKIFDASKHRVKGTEAEKYVAKKGKTSTAPKVSPAIAAVKPTQTTDSSKKSNWRKKHEEFINAIREAKKVQAYLAKGGKLSDLPPPPPSENPDYIQCPHCNRRFNESAAERHIPKCANMQHNKPKPVQKKRF
ncbi:uncharacterized protein LOC142225634 isoform X2 [Haematobia irritans]|uniref:uncharacterized protein LOC142225634 isoform X2 n=1 Tax=Haematobia irritans TaxID=7368 RepID=UPI003F501EDD